MASQYQVNNIDIVNIKPGLLKSIGVKQGKVVNMIKAAIYLLPKACPHNPLAPSPLGAPWRFLVR